MAGVNKVILIGNLGADPEVKYLPSGSTVANIRLATTESYTTREGERVKQTEWHNIVAWGKLAEKCSEIKKSDKLVVEGEINTKKVNDRYYTGIKASDIYRWDYLKSNNNHQDEPEESNFNGENDLPF